jgi:TonB family protein
MLKSNLIVALLVSSSVLFSGAACAQTAQERADEYLQQTVIDPMNAQRTLNGQPVFTLEEYLTANRNWQNEMIAHLDKHKIYPAGRSQDAEILVSFTLDRTGHVLSASIVNGSGDAAFDEAALAMVRKSDPVPAPPQFIADEGLNFTLPVIFRASTR